MAPRLTPSDLRGAIAGALWHNSAYELEAVCAGLGLDTSKASDDPFNSKKRYVRELLYGLDRNQLLGVARKVIDEYGSEDLEAAIGVGDIRGVDGELRNLIFAAAGPKPRIVLRDAIDNVIEIVENAEHCLVYDEPLPDGELSWAALVDWWGANQDAQGPDRLAAARALYERLFASLQSPPEQLLFSTFCARYGEEAGFQQPALIPQVYLHYDPYTARELGEEGQVLARQRMDFLLLLPERVRVVIEVDGKQHYSSGAELDRPDPSRYAAMVREDRRLRLDGYEVYRFGGHELCGTEGEATVREFFNGLFERHGVGGDAGAT